jgi:hypothetical protein
MNMGRSDRCVPKAIGRNGHFGPFVKFFFEGEATIPCQAVITVPFRSAMERIRSADRSQLIRFSMVVFAVLALVSFALAGVVG